MKLFTAESCYFASPFPSALPAALPGDIVQLTSSLVLEPAKVAVDLSCLREEACSPLPLHRTHHDEYLMVPLKGGKVAG